MRQPRTNVLLIAILLVIVGLIGRAWFASPQVSVPPAAIAETSSHATEALVDSPNVAIRTAPHSVHIIARAEQLPADDSALVVAMCNLQLMAGDTNLSLSSDQWSTLASVVVRTQAIRRNYEAQIATGRTVAPGKFLVDIPMYARFGDELRRQFTAELRIGLGDAIATEVLAKMGGRLETSFAGFGIGWQTFEISGDPAANLSDVQIAQTACYWDSVEGADHPTVSREIHFPATDDPTGDSWGALLAMVGKRSGEKGPI